MAAMVPAWSGEGHYAQYGWYYVTQAAFHGGNKSFKAWNEPFVKMLLQKQKPDGRWQSPAADDVELEDALKGMDPFYATTLNALSLQVYYRYLPTYQDPGTIAKPKDVFDVETDDLGLGEL